MVHRQGGIALPAWVRALLPAALLIAVQQIVWPMPIEKLVLSEKDTQHPTLAVFVNRFIYGKV